MCTSYFIFKSGCKILNDGHFKILAKACPEWGEGNYREPFLVVFHYLGSTFINAYIFTKFKILVHLSLKLCTLHLFFKLDCKISNDGHINIFVAAYTGWGEGNAPEPFGVAFHRLISWLLLKLALLNLTFAIYTKTIFLKCFQFFSTFKIVDLI